jgi:uncharacterized protein YdcH (DUF465 family)
MTTHTENHLKHLEDQHRDLNKQIDTLEKTGIFEDHNLEVLKKQRLHLKDEIAKIKLTLKH